MTIRITGMNSGLDTDSIVSELVSAYRAKGDKYTKAQTKLSWTQNVWKSLNTKIFNFYKSLDSFRFGGTASKKTTVSDSTKATVTASNSAVSGTQTLEINSLAKGGYLTGAELKKADASKEGKLAAGSTLSELGITANGKIKIEGSEGTKEIEVSADMKISDFVKQVNESGTGVKASFDADNQRFFISSEKTGKANDFKISEADDNGTSALAKLGISNGTKVDAADAEITLNDVKYTSSSNTFKINGLTIQAQAVTDGEVTITTDTDVQGMYDKIKNFLSDYNALMTEMASLYNADSSKGYEPLTSDEKESMSDTEINEWEKKIKDSLLRRDSTLGGIMSAMSTAMSSTVNVNGTNYSLSNLGIKTLGYFASGKNEKNLYHIDGDADDENTSNNADKLMEMLTSDPEAVVEIIKGVTSNLYKNLDSKMKSTSLRSAYTVYNDKEMAKSYSDYTTTIKEWNKKVESIEDSYYKKFSAMETALAKLQSQMSSFTSMLG